jgi:hypothetical protein
MTLKKVIKVDLYSCALRFIVTDNMRQEYMAVCKKNNFDSTYTEVEGVFIWGGSGKEYYLLIDLDKLTHNTISHEIYHAASRICEHRDVQDEESRAWLSGYIAEQIYKFLDKKRLNVKHG